MRRKYLGEIWHFLRLVLLWKDPMELERSKWWCFWMSLEFPWSLTILNHPQSSQALLEGVQLSGLEGSWGGELIAGYITGLGRRWFSVDEITIFVVSQPAILVKHCSYPNVHSWPLKDLKAASQPAGGAQAADSVVYNSMINACHWSQSHTRRELFPQVVSRLFFSSLAKGVRFWAILIEGLYSDCLDLGWIFVWLAWNQCWRKLRSEKYLTGYWYFNWVSFKTLVTGCHRSFRSRTPCTLISNKRWDSL